MKTKLLFTFALFSFIGHLFGQIENNNISDKEIDQYLKIKEKMKVLSEKINNVEKEKIANLKIINNIAVYSEDQLESSNIKVDSIYIVIRDGIIRNIEVKMKGYTNKFTNLNVPIGLTARRFEKNVDRLEQVGSRGKKWIRFQELIQLNNWVQFIPDDMVIEYPKYNNENIVLYKSNSMNTIFDVRLYTDALALMGQEKNGLAQTDLKFRQIIHRSNSPNLPFFFLQYFNINFNYSKFDSKDEYLNVNSFSNVSLLRNRFVNAELALNIMNAYIGYKSLNKFYLDVGAGVGALKIVKSSNDSTKINNTNIFLEAGTNFKFASNGGININVRAIRLFSPSTSDYNDQLNVNYFNFLKFGAEIYWNPLGQDANRIFARINYVEPTSALYKKDGFFQLQIGYSLLLSELIGKK